MLKVGGSAVDAAIATSLALGVLEPWIAQDMARLRRNEACAAWFLPGGLPPSAPAAVSGKHGAVHGTVCS